MSVREKGENVGVKKMARIPIGRKLTRLLACNVAVLFCCLAFQLFIRVGLVERSYQFEQLRRQAVTNDERLRSLRYSLASGRRSASIMKRASSELGLDSLAPEQIRRVNDSGEV